MSHTHLLKSLRPDDSFFLAFFANCPIGLNLCKIDGKWLQSNPAFLNTIGYTAEEADDGNLTYWQLTPPEYSEDEKVQLKNLNERGSYGPYTKEFIRKDGRRVPVRLNGFLIERDGEKYIWSMIEDLSTQSHLREELSQSETFYHAILDSLPIGVFAKDLKRDWAFVLWNRAAQETFGLSKEKVLGKTDFEIFPKEQATQFRETDTRTMKGGEKIEVNAEWVQLPGQSEKWYQTTKIPFNDAAGSPRYLLGITQDITKKKTAEDSLKEAMETARKASVAKSEFLSNMSHEIRTPLHAMLGVGELLEKTKLDEEQKKYLRILSKSGSRLLVVVNDILDLEKIESGRITIKHQPEKLNTVINSVYDLMAVPARQAKLEIRNKIEIQPDLTVLTDAGVIHQILTNIIGNSIKFTPANGSIEVIAKWEPNTAVGKGQLVVTVRDTGIGIAKESLNEVFEPFRQGDSSVGKKYGGSGLGLTIVDKLVAKLQGGIYLESEVGRGTSVTLNIPMEISLEKTVDRTKSVAETKPPVSVDDRKKSRILVVDDSPDNQLLACEILRKSNYDVVLANDGFEALKVFESTRPALILLDVGMPVMDGYETIRHIRKREEELHLSPTPVVALTGYALKTDVERALSAGFDKHLAKPFNMTQLLGVVEEMLS